MQTDDEQPGSRPAIGAGYPLFQLAKALTTAETHEDLGTRERASVRAAEWTAAINGMLAESISDGSRTPLGGVPGWVTLKVLTGGFASGEMAAGGPLLPHERHLLARIGNVTESDARRVLNNVYLSDDGLANLQQMLRSGSYEIDVPEEGALLMAAWLVQNGHVEQARKLLDEIGPWLSELRFYPVPAGPAIEAGDRVCLQYAGSTVERLNCIGPTEQILAQYEQVCIWTPLYDRAVGLFVETVEGELPTLKSNEDGRWERAETGAFPVQGGWPCGRFPEGWAPRVEALLAECDSRSAEFQRCKRPRSGKESFMQLRGYLRRCILDPASLRGRDVGRIRQILACYISKRGAPDSPRNRTLREQQVQHAGVRTYQQLSAVVTHRLRAYPPDQGVDDISPIIQPISSSEALQTGIPEGAVVPKPIRRKVERCLRATPYVLVERGLITSADKLADVLPQITTNISSQCFEDPVLQSLAAAIYAAFKRRQSLLLLNLEKQIQVEELPWIAALREFERADAALKGAALHRLEQVSLLTVASFPQAIIPNKLIRELRTLAAVAELDLPFQEEIAADIFMNEFSATYLRAAKQAALVLDTTLYAAYYGIDFEPIRAMQHIQPGMSWRYRHTAASPFVDLCSARAGPRKQGTAANGMVIEQQQILTSQNLAVMFAELGLAYGLYQRLDGLAQHCFKWICRRLQMKTDRHHARLIQIKNTAYAWRQMLFYLSLIPPSRVTEFLIWAEEHLARQPEEFRLRFRPALTGLRMVSESQSLDTDAALQAGAKRFLGWSTERHWLLRDSDRS